jgi:hypothetical protein
MTHRRRGTGSRGAGGVRRAVIGLGLLLAALGAPAAVHAQSTCNTNLAFDYTTSHAFQAIGDVVTVKLTLSTQSIVNGTKVTLNRLRFDLDCDIGAPLGVGCMDDGPGIQYEGDATIQTNCPDMEGGSTVSFSTGHAVGTSPNQVVFTPSVPIMIPPNRADYCFVQFDIRVLASSSDATPTVTEEVAGFSAATGDAQCDNGLASAGSQSGSLRTCPICNDANACTTETCNTTTGACDTTSTVTCTDGNACTTESCNATTGACQTTSTVTCTDGNACTTESCNATTGACQTTSTVTCTDGNACTTESCNATTGACQTTSTVTCTDGNACTTESCNATTGACQTTSTVTCDDGNACTTESCNTTTGACQTTGTATCNDGNACTTEICNVATGQCETTGQVACNDDNLCTEEACNPQTGRCETTHTTVCQSDDPCIAQRCNPATGQCESGGVGSGLAFLVRTVGQFGNGSDIRAGVGANDTGGTLRFGRSVLASDSTQLVGNLVSLGNTADVFDVLANALQTGKDVHIRGHVGVPELPINDPYCPIPVIECGTTAITVPSRASMGPLAPGTYGAVTIMNGGTLTLLPGKFVFCSFRTGRSAAVVTTGAGATHVDVAHGFRLANGSTFGPQAGSPTPRLNVGSSSVRIGAGSTLQAFLSAPSSLLSLGRGSLVRGSFCVLKSKSDKGIHLECPPVEASPAAALLDTTR